MATGNSNLLLMDPSAVHGRYFLCNAHFDEKSFTNLNGNRLKNNSIPTHNISPFMSTELINEYTANLDKWKGKY